LKKPILITGIHRSGTTFTGRMLSMNKNIAYVHEPFNPEYGLKEFDLYFKYLTEENIDGKIDNIINKIINLNKVNYELPNINSDNILKEKIKYIFRKIIPTKPQLEYNYYRLHPFINRVLVKDPIACLSSQFLHRKYGFEVVILIRHPLSFVGSIKRLNWGFDFNNFLNQPILMQDYLYMYKDEMINFSNSRDEIVEIGTLLWNCIYSVLFDYIKNNPKMIVVKHEDLSLKPIETFTNLYNKLNINFTKKNKEKINELTSEENDVKAENNKAHDFNRNSKELVKYYKNILTKNEIKYISQKTKKLSSLFYSY